MQINESRAIELVMKLMAVPGKSCEEREVAHEVIATLKEYGVDDAAISFDSAHQRTPLPGQVGNLIVKLPGDRRLPRLMLSAHLDTVPICVGCQPKRVGKLIRSANARTGLGADDRAGVAAVLIALVESLERQSATRPPLTLCFFVQEEIGLQGSRNLTLSKLGKPAMAINFDGGNPAKMTVGATGGERLKIKLHGLAAHAGLAPQDGANALHAAGLAIAALHKGKWLGAVKKNGRQGTSNIGIVRGGVATNVVADFAEIDAEARSHVSEFRQEIADAFEAAFMQAAAKIQSSTGTAVRAEVLRRVDYDSFRLDENSEVVMRAQAAIGGLGLQPQMAISNGGVDANWLVKHGIPTVTLGCGQRDVHTNSESLDIDDFLVACRIAVLMINNPNMN